MYGYMQMHGLFFKLITVIKHNYIATLISYLYSCIVLWSSPKQLWTKSYHLFPAAAFIKFRFRSKLPDMYMNNNNNNNNNNMEKWATSIMNHYHGSWHYCGSWLLEKVDNSAVWNFLVFIHSIKQSVPPAS